MATLYIRDVSDPVAETLKRRAATQGVSLSAYVALELSKLASRPTNEEIVERLRTDDRTDGPTRSDILEAVRDVRR